MAFTYAEQLMRLGIPAETAKKFEEMVSEGGLQIGTTATTAMAGDRTPTPTIRGGVLLQSAVPSLTGTVGTANDAMTAVAAATAATTDATAASLASVNTSITAINNNLADLQAKVNSILTALRATGVLTP